MGIDTDDIDELFFKELREIARSTALVVMVTDVTWEPELLTRH